ncbi:MAG: DinB family protein [Pyrinomonadaceae bacterium]|nr:DinB family protein [Pyrinomonadaceae bacterium]
MPPEDLQDLIDDLTQTPQRVASLVKDLSEPDLRARNSSEEFSVVENVCHLRDIEIEGYTQRIVKILRENNPLLPDIDGSRLAVEREYQSQNLSEALQAFADARKRNTQTLKGLVAEQLDREGTLEGVGSVTIRGLLLMMRDHDADHIRELSSIRERPNPDN